jgi:arginyl-tRNA synthetase
MNLYLIIRDRVVAILADLVPGLDPAVLSRVEVTPARDPAHGDMATNAALLAAKPARRAPAAIAADLAARLTDLPEVAHAEAAGPGFVNLRLHPATLQSILPTILASGERFGDCTAGQGTRVNVEYVSANPTGPLTVGHCRGAVVGDALANLMAKAGYAVTREYYVNDAGNQVATLAWAAYWRYLQALGTPMTEPEFAAQVPGGMQYSGAYLIAIGADLAARHGPAYAGPGLTVADPALWLTLFRDETMAILLAEIRQDLARLHVHQEVFTSERAILAEGAPDAAIAALAARGLIYQGVLEPPKGKLPDDWEAREQTLFAATRFGDDVDRPLRKSDGSNTYFANDIGYHADKLARGFQIIIDVLGADHGGYVSRMRAAVKALSDGRAEFDVVLCQIVHVLRGGVPVKMSKRAGTYVTLADLLDEVGPDAVRFTMLMRKNDAQMEFDIDAAIAQTRDNPVFYVQYAHARCRSVLRMAADILTATNTGTDDAALARADLSPLSDPSELAVLRRLLGWPRLVEAAALAREPHRVAFYLYELAGDFHMLWNKGRESTILRFIQVDAPEATRARLALVAAVAVTIRSGLAVLGVTPVEEMR